MKKLFFLLLPFVAYFNLFALGPTEIKITYDPRQGHDRARVDQGKVIAPKMIAFHYIDGTNFTLRNYPLSFAYYHRMRILFGVGCFTSFFMFVFDKECQESKEYMRKKIRYHLEDQTGIVINMNAANNAILATIQSKDSK